MLNYIEIWLLAAVPLNIKDDKHWQIKHCAFIKNVATFPAVLLHLDKEVCGIVERRIANMTQVLEPSWH